MGGINIWQDFYLLTPGLYTSANRWVKKKHYLGCSFDVQNKIVEHHKIESDCKKRVKALKIPISTTRVIIKRFQSTKYVKNLPGRGRVYIVLMHAEE